MTDTKELRNYEGYLLNNNDSNKDYTHIGKVKVNTITYSLYAWFEEKEIINEYNRREKIKYFALLSTKDSMSPSKINKNMLKTNIDSIGILTVNKQRESHTYPHYRGSVKLEDSLFYLACWKNTKEDLIDGELVIKARFFLKVASPQTYNKED